MIRSLAILICLVVLAINAQSVVAQSVERSSLKSPEVAKPALRGSNQSRVNVENSILQNQLDRLLKRREELIRQHDQSQNRLDEAEERLGKLEMSVESYPEIVKMLQLRRVELVIQIEGIKSRIDALTQTVKEKAESSRATLEQVVKFHTDAVEIAERLLHEEQRKKSGEVSAAWERELQLKKAQLDLAMAKAELAKGSSTTNSELISLTTDRAEKTAQLKIAQELLAEVAKARPWVREISNGREDLKKFSERLMLLESDYSQLSMDLEAARDIAKQRYSSTDESNEKKE